MRRFASFRFFTIILAGCLLITGCTGNQAALVVEATSTKTETPKPTLTQIIIEDKSTPVPQITNTAEPTQPLPSDTPGPTNTPTWAFHEPGSVIAPILLYHKVEGEVSTSRYQVTVSDFRAQMQALHDLGYSAIPISLLVETILQGGDLPEKPIVITFDDGHQSVYENALPIMNDFGFSGVFYIVANRINGAPNFVNVDQIEEMINAGWEIGSHGYTHADVTENHVSVSQEIAYSKIDLEAALSADIITFAYPFGKIDPFVAGKVIDYGYSAGMGLGTAVAHSRNTLYYLDRIEVYSSYTMEDFYRVLKND